METNIIAIPEEFYQEDDHQWDLPTSTRDHATFDLGFLTPDSIKGKATRISQ